MTMRTSTLLTITSAVLFGAIVGIGTAPDKKAGSEPSPSGSIAPSSTLLSGMAVATGIKRRREPEAGDHWAGCNDARAMGTAPIYRGEPGYDEKMDGDDDGIACEPRPDE